MKDKPQIIGTSALQLNINDGGLYDSILESRNKVKQQQNTAEVIPFQKNISNIALVQTICLNLAKQPTINIAGVNISFVDDVWDFRAKYKPGKSLQNYKFNIMMLREKDCHFTDYSKSLIKLFTIYVITEYGLDCGTNSHKINEAKKFLFYLQEHHIYSLDAVTLKEVKEFYNSSNILYSTFIKIRRWIQTFIIFYSLLTGHNIYTQEMAEWFNDIETKKIKTIIEDHKTPCPPTEFYQKYSKYHYNRVFDENVPLIERGMSGLLYIGSQTGLRGSELTILEEDNLETFILSNGKDIRKLDSDETDTVLSKSTDNDTKLLGILHYRATKNGGHRGNVYTIGETNAPRKVIMIYQKLRHLFSEERKKHKTTALVPHIASKHARADTYRSFITERSLYHYNKNICIRNAAAFGLIDTPEAELFEGSVLYFSDQYTNEHGKKVNYRLKDMRQSGAKLGQTISYITITQFRVYVASDYHERGVDDRTISFLFNHKSNGMWGYYVRDAHPVQENIDFSKEIVTEVVRDHTKIIGPKGDAFSRKIQDIIQNNKLKVSEDLDAIVDKVCGEMPIRAKVGGFCMKANPDRDCWYDGVTDEMMCAYGCCPNNCHMYFMAPISLNKAREIAELIEYNETCGYINAAEKEAYKLDSCLKMELLPELKEVKREFEIHGELWIVERHPDVKDIIDNVKAIQEEIKTWQATIQRMTP